MSNPDMSDFAPSGEKAAKESTRDGFLLHVLGAVLLLALVGFAVPRVEAIYTNFGVRLPRATLNILRASHLGAYLAPIFVVLLATDRLVLKGLKRLGDAEWQWQRFYTKSVSIGLAAIILWTFAAMSLPLTCCRMRLSG